MGNAKRDEEKEEKLGATFEELFGVPRACVEGSAGPGVPFDQSFDFAEDLIDKYGLGTGPTTPNSSHQCGDVEKRETEPGNQEETQPEVLGKKSEPEEVKLAVLEIEEDSGIPINLDPREQDINRDQSPARKGAQGGEFPSHISRVDEFARAIVIDGGDSFETRLIGAH